MNKIKELLTFENISITDEQIRELVSQKSLDINSLTDEDAAVIVGSIKASQNSISPTGGLAVSNGASIPTKGKTPAKGRKNAKQLTFKDALVHAAKETEGELSTVEKAIRQQKTQYINHRSNSLVSEIRNTSTEIVEAVTDKLMEEKADAETFQQIGTAFAEGLFPLS